MTESPSRHALAMWCWQLRPEDLFLVILNFCFAHFWFAEMQAGMSFLLLEIHGRPERGSSPQTPSTAELEMSEWLLILRVLENYVLVELEISLGSTTRCESREKYLKATIMPLLKPGGL
jgi:hypothetical protein